ncbi:hypothetical protein LSAT2_001320 [Lamellibrachia satsuma]|nr:hypothetical protein LSAT2_001320 [Lamellibrachia satsuma]
MSSDLYLIKRRVDFNAGLSRWHVMTTSFVTAVSRHLGTAMLYHDHRFSIHRVFEISESDDGKTSKSFRVNFGVCLLIKIIIASPEENVRRDSARVVSWRRGFVRGSCYSRKYKDLGDGNPGIKTIRSHKKLTQNEIHILDYSILRCLHERGPWRKEEQDEDKVGNRRRLGDVL